MRVVRLVVVVREMWPVYVLKRVQGVVVVVLVVASGFRRGGVGCVVGYVFFRYLDVLLLLY